MIVIIYLHGCNYGGGGKCSDGQIGGLRDEGTAPICAGHWSEAKEEEQTKKILNKKGMRAQLPFATQRWSLVTGQDQKEEEKKQRKYKKKITNQGLGCPLAPKRIKL